MNAESTLSTHYQYVKDADGYSFVSDAGVEYYAYFHRHHEIESCLVYEFGFECRGERPPADMKIRHTIKAILADFWTDNRDVLLFVCESLDGSSSGRMRLFDIWYRNLAAGTGIVKFDFPVVDNFCASLLSYADNPLASNAIMELSELFEAMWE